MTLDLILVYTGYKLTSKKLETVQGSQDSVSVSIDYMKPTDSVMDIQT